MKYDLTKFRKFLPDELIPAPNHRGTEGYVCPRCGSGTHKGDKSTGAVSYFPGRDDGTLLWHCKSCQHTGDIYDYVSLKKNMAKGDAVRHVIKKYADRLESEEVTEDHQQEVKPVAQANPKQQVQPEPKSKRDQGQQPRKDYSDYVRKRAAELPDGIGVGVVDIYLKKRGFTRETIKQYQLGAEVLVLYHDDRHRPTYSPGVVIPFIDAETGGIPYYTIRVIKANGEERYKNPPKDEAGGVPIYHPESLYASGTCFVVEGALDALSILQVGAEATALNGIGNTSKLIEALREKPTASKLVICLDNDGNEATERSARELTEQLQAMGFDAVCDNSVCGDYKDPNEHLVADPAGFKAAVLAKIEAFQPPEKLTSVHP